MTSRDPERSNSWPQYTRAQYLEKILELQTSNLVCSFVSRVPSGRTNNYPKSGRGLGQVTLQFFWRTISNISLKLLELETSNLIHGFVWAMPSRRINNFPESRRGLGHVTLTIFGSTVGYPSDSLASCFSLSYTYVFRLRVVDLGLSFFSF